MKIYVAGKTEEYRRVRRMQELCVELGHEITFDWTPNVEDNLRRGNGKKYNFSPTEARKYATADRKGVQDCDMLLGLMHAAAKGTYVELGLAEAWGKKILLVGANHMHCVFVQMEGIVHVDADLQVVPYLTGQREFISE